MSGSMWVNGFKCNFKSLGFYRYEMVNNIRLTWKLACMLRTYRTCNPIVRFPKYEYNNKLLCGVTLLKVILDVT